MMQAVYPEESPMRHVMFYLMDVHTGCVDAIGQRKRPRAQDRHRGPFRPVQGGVQEGVHNACCRGIPVRRHLDHNPALVSIEA